MYAFEYMLLPYMPIGELYIEDCCALAYGLGGTGGALTFCCVALFCIELLVFVTGTRPNAVWMPGCCGPNTLGSEMVAFRKFATLSIIRSDFGSFVAITRLCD